jgi:fructan beta-fructosidase
MSCLAMMQIAGSTLSAQVSDKPMHEAHRPQIHFSPEKNWMNDPNGMVYSNGVYHLFFQHHPFSAVWGPMHWGHAISTDLIHWKQEPIALYPDSIGTIFSGSAVVDRNNTSGFGRNGHAPLVAIFTQHDPNGQRAGRNDFQTQSIAYSNDEGRTWTKYSGNPVVRNPGISDFRDPKVMWYAPGKKWVMTLATKEDITFFSSPDLKRWKKESEFGKGVGSHASVWECPDLLEFDDHGRKVWALLVSLGNGAPNGGAGIQYFLGTFNGNTFVSDQQEVRWLDNGPDDYAGVTWSNTGERKIFIGWMANPMYAGQVPTEKWRSASTLPRDLKLKQVGNETWLASTPVPELAVIREKAQTFTNIKVAETMDLARLSGAVHFPCRINLDFGEIKDFSLVLSNDAGEQVVIGYDKGANQYFIDRTRSGKSDFNKGFAGRHTVPRRVNTMGSKISLIIDVSSVELFADDGVSVMTEIFFPVKPYSEVHLGAKEGVLIKQLEYAGLKSIWP